jgi:predicted DNA binding CopG/RHH family protein
MAKIRLDKEEQAILASVEAGEWLPVDDLEARKEEYQKIARATFRKDSRVNIRLPKRDVTAIKVKAMEEGIPYQTMMASILHKYVTGRLVEKQS